MYRPCGFESLQLFWAKRDEFDSGFFQPNTVNPYAEKNLSTEQTRRRQEIFLSDSILFQIFRVMAQREDIPGTRCRNESWQKAGIIRRAQKPWPQNMRAALEPRLEWRNLFHPSAHLKNGCGAHVRLCGSRTFPTPAGRSAPSHL